MKQKNWLIALALVASAGLAMACPCHKTRLAPVSERIVTKQCYTQPVMVTTTQYVEMERPNRCSLWGRCHVAPVGERIVTKRVIYSRPIIAPVAERVVVERPAKCCWRPFRSCCR